MKIRNDNQLFFFIFFVLKQIKGAKMNINIYDTKDKLYDAVLDLYIKSLNENPKMTLGLATGSTPIPLYERLIKAYQNKLISFKTIKTFNLDEYLGLEQEHDQSYYHF